MAQHQSGPLKDRAHRFPIRMTVLFRPSGDVDWRMGRTANVSRSGVLFGADGLMDPDTPVEVGLILMEETGADPAPQIMCFGNIVRAAAAPGEKSPTMAARFFDYRFVGAEGH